MAVPARYPVADQARRAALAKVHLAKKELGLDDATYRAVLERITGHDSASACSVAELGRVLDEFKAKGWTPRVLAGGRKGPPRAASGASQTRRPADHPAAKKARAMWISLHQLGVVRDPSDAALEAFARRQLKVEALQWADQGGVYKLIEALKAMAERAGWSQDVQTAKPKLQVRILKVNLIRAQCLRLRRRFGVGDLLGFTDQQLDERIRDLAAEIHTELERGA